MLIVKGAQNERPNSSTLPRSEQLRDIAPHPFFDREEWLVVTRIAQTRDVCLRKAHFRQKW